MSALKEFANFMTLNMANLAVTYAQLLEESGGGYANIPADRRTASARRLLKAVIEAYESESADPLCRLFDGRANEDLRRWAKDIEPPQPMLEVECLGQTLVPVVTNLEASKFLWQILSQVRATVFQAEANFPQTPSVPPAPPLTAISPPTLSPIPSTFHDDGGQKGESLRDNQEKLKEPVDIDRDITQPEQVEEVLEEDLQISEATIRSLLISTDEAVMLLDEKGFIDCNEATLKIFGYTSKDQFINTHPSEQSPPQQPNGQDSWTAANERIATAYKEGSHRFEWLHCRTDGTPFPAEVLLTAVELEGKRILQAIVRDISKYKQAEEDILKFKLGIERSSDAFFLTDINGQIIYTNSAFEEVYGYSRDEALGKTPRILKSGLTSQEEYKHFWNALLAKQVVAGEIVNKTKDGRLITIAGSNNPIVNETGDIIGFLAIHRDITERKQAEEGLQESEHRLQTIMDAVQAGIVIIDAETRNIVDANPAALQIIGAPKDEVIGSICHQFICPAERGRCPVCDLGQTVDHSERVLLTFQGEVVPIIKNVVKVALKGREYLVESFVNITQQKQAEETLAKQAAELETVAQVSAITSTILNTRELLQAVVNLTKERFGLYHAHIYLLNETDDMLNLAAGAGEVGQQMVAEGWQIPLEREQSLVAQVARTRRGLIVNDVHQEPGWLPNSLLPDTRSELAVPLIVGNRVLGVLDVQAEEVDYFTEEDVHVQTMLATQVAVALQNASLYKQAQDALEETLILPQFSQALAGTLRVDKILNIFFEACTNEIGFEYVQLTLVDEEQNRLKAVGGVGVSERKLKRTNRSLDSDDILADIVRTGKTEVITGWDKRLDMETFEAEGYADWVRVFAPVTLRQENVGVVEAGFNKNRQAFIQDSQIRLLGAFIDQTALALDNAQRYEASQRIARREQTIRQITEKMRTATSLDELVKTAAEELGERLSAGHAVVELGVE